MKHKFQIGVAETTINPRTGMQIDGNIGAYRPARFVIDDLHARAIVFQKGKKRFLLFSLELLAVTREWSDAIRDLAAGEFGFDRDAVAVHVVQNHSSPSLGHIMLSDRFAATRKYPWLRGSDPAYGPLVLKKIKPLIRAALADLRPVRLLFGSSYEARVSFNRRVAMRDGTSQMHLSSRQLGALYIEGPSDPEVGVALFTTPELRTTAVLLHHTCHPVHWDPHTAIHSDWPGAWAGEVRRTLLPGAVPLVLNGCCGNVHHNNPLVPDREDTPQSMARLLTAAARTALVNPCYGDDDPALGYKTIRFGIPFRHFPKKVFEDARRLLEKNPEPIWTDATHTRHDHEWFFAASLMDLERLMKTHDAFEYEIQAVRLGDLAILILPGEPFVEAQLDIKQRSPAKRTFLAHMSNRYVGYIPTPEAIRRGGFEARPSFASKLEPAALQTIADKSVALLKELYA